MYFLEVFKYCYGSQETTRTSAASLPFKGCRTSEKEKAFDDNNVDRVTLLQLKALQQLHTRPKSRVSKPPTLQSLCN